jgi:hypothetical protein
MNRCRHASGPLKPTFGTDTGRSGIELPAKRANGKQYQKYVGLKIRDFRRSAVRSLILSGLPQNTAMRITGHKTAEIFRRYDIIDDRDLEDATEGRERASEPGLTQKSTHHFSEATVPQRKILATGRKEMAGTMRLELAPSAMTALSEMVLQHPTSTRGNR